LALGLKPIVAINKIDKPMARPDEVLDMIFDLFSDLGASNEQLDFSYVYAIAREGIAKRAIGDDSKDLTPLFDMIMEKVTPARQDFDKPFRMQPSNLAYDNFLGRLAVGRVYEGVIESGKQVYIKDANGVTRTGKISKIFVYQGLNKVEAKRAEAGDIVVIAGIPDVYVGETLLDDPNTEALPAISIDPPTLSMTFMVNDSPFAGKEGKFVTTRHIKARLEKEMETNVGLQIEDIPNSDAYKVSGRGELHLSVLLESMRREGFEVQVSRPQVIMREEGHKKMEPVEQVICDVPDEFSGKIIELLSKRKGELVEIKSENNHTRLEFKVPTRGLLGFRSDFIIETKGEGILTHAFVGYEEYKGEIPHRTRGSLISGENDSAMAYSLWKLEERGRLFIRPQTAMYEGMIIGECAKENDLVVNAAKNKKLTNVRASGTDEAIRLTPIQDMTLERALEYIGDDEYVEITPQFIRLRKKYLTEVDRKRNKS
jgi:GTP-binding protein